MLRILRSPLRVPLPLPALFAVALALGATGCADKAKAPYEECVKLEAQWEKVKARDACKRAVEADPKSRSGLAAAGKLTYLNPEADKIVAAEQKANAPCRTGKWVTHCMWQGKPRPTLMEESTYAKCNKSADEVRVIGMTCPECVCSDRFVDPYKDEE